MGKWEVDGVEVKKKNKKSKLDKLKRAAKCLRVMDMN